jgi:hypothetical protein
MCPHWGIADGEAPRSQPHKIVPAKDYRERAQFLPQERPSWHKYNFKKI